MHLSDCGALVPYGGSTNGTASGIDTVRILTCNVGYTLQGDGIVRCGEDGMWNGNSTCTIKGKFVSVACVTFTLYMQINVHQSNDSFCTCSYLELTLRPVLKEILQIIYLFFCQLLTLSRT